MISIKAFVYKISIFVLECLTQVDECGFVAWNFKLSLT